MKNLNQLFIDSRKHKAGINNYNISIFTTPVKELIKQSDLAIEAKRQQVANEIEERRTQFLKALKHLDDSTKTKKRRWF